MATAFNTRKRIRRFFGHIESVAPMPNLIEVQKSSYESFLQRITPAAKRTQSGLQEVFRGVFPIKDFAERASLEFVKYEFEEPKYDVEECQQRGITYAAPLKVTLQLVVWDIDEEAGSRSIRDIKEQDVYMGDMPLMTDNGTFIVNGTERVIVSQMHRSPGVFFDHDKGKTHSSGKYLFAARIIPYRGSWLDFEFDAKDLIHVRIDRRRKIPVTTLLLALDNDATAKKRASAAAKGQTLDPAEAQGLSPEEILAAFYGQVVYKRDKEGWNTDLRRRVDEGRQAHPRPGQRQDRQVGGRGRRQDDAAPPEPPQGGGPQGNARVGRGADRPLRRGRRDQREERRDLCRGRPGDHPGRARPVRRERASTCCRRSRSTTPMSGPYIRNTLAADKNSNREEALLDIYRVMRPGEPPTLEQAETLFERPAVRHRPLRPVAGRPREDEHAAGASRACPTPQRTLRREDILAVVKVLHDLKDGRGEIDDIDHLGNRRVRSVGELMENQYRVGLLRMERAIRERMSSIDIDTVMPHDLINAKPAAAAVREFFGSSQLSQFMDQTNPLSEVTHKRRLSALGPGGLTRERAGFEVRDVHPTHYGRICPIETPEGPNIGLINSLATYARVNQYGFIESPYRKVHGQPRQRRGDLSLGDGGGPLHGGPGQRRDRREGQVRLRAGAVPQGRRVHPRPARDDRLRRRLAQADRLGRRGADPVPRERRRQPRADGLEHAAPGGAADPGRIAAGRHRHGRGGGPRTRAWRSPRAAPASSTRSTPCASSCARPTTSAPTGRRSTSTTC